MTHNVRLAPAQHNKKNSRMPDFKMNLRSVLAGATAIGATSALPSYGQSSRTVRLLTWEGYAEDARVADFEAATGGKVNISYAGG